MSAFYLMLLDISDLLFFKVALLPLRQSLRPQRHLEFLTCIICNFYAILFGGDEKGSIFAASK